MSDDHDGEQKRPHTPVARRLAAHRFVLLTAGAAAFAAVLFLDLPPVAALAGMIAIVLAALVDRPAAQVAAAPDSRAGARPVWPESGIKLTLEAIGEPCFLTDAKGILRYQNEAAVARFGAGRPGDPLSFKLRVPELLAAVEAAGRGAASDRLSFTERVPTERVYAATATPIATTRRGGRGGPDFVLVRLVDETERMRTERMRADFVANASHELRTPLASLTGFIETLLGAARDDAVNRERFLRIMLDQARRMGRLIDDLLSLSRIEMKAHIAPEGTVDLDEVVRQTADLLAPLAAGEGASIAVDVGDAPVVVRGDRDELVQVVSNLVENAIKYGRPGGRVAVALEPETGSEGGNGVRLTVADDGPGIAAEHLPRLTERFYRVDAEGSRRTKGTGLGLAIVKHIVNRHRGRLTFRSVQGEGTTATVWLPALSVEERPPL